MQILFSFFVECGLEKKSKRDYKPWQMFVLGKIPPVTVHCSGTIITSNLLVTAHNCLQKFPSNPDAGFNVFDAWFPSNGRVYEPKNVVISKSSNSFDSTYKIVSIIYNHRYGVNLAANNHPTDNLVIFRVTPDFTKDPELGPVCLPEATYDADELIGKYAYFYGYAALRQGYNSRSWDYVDKCVGSTPPSPPTTTTTTTPSTTTTKSTTTPSTTTNVDHTVIIATDDDIDFVTLGPPPAAILQNITGEIMRENECSHETFKRDKQLLCFRRAGKKLVPKYGDGALFVESGKTKKRHFLVGTAAGVDDAMDDSHELINFSKVPG